MTALVRYEAARQALADARSVDDVKEIRDVAEAMRAYARQAKNKGLELDAREIRWRAERRLGEIIRAQKATAGLNEGGRPKKTPSTGEGVSKATLEEAGIDYKLSSRSQQYAAMDEDSFDRLVARVREREEAENEPAPLDLLRADEKAARRAKDSAELHERITHGGKVADLHDLAASGARFSVILADPPWEFKVWSGEGKDRSADNHYKTDGMEGIKALPVPALAADNCALFMWCVMPELPGALDVIKAWGFEYKTVAFTWMKQNPSGDGLFMGMGYWTRANAELCLLATKGKPGRLHADVRQAILAPVMEHSRKPDDAHQRIERLLGGPYLELYARRERDGWLTWGNELPFKPLPPHDAETGEIIEHPSGDVGIVASVDAVANVDDSAGRGWNAAAAAVSRTEPGAPELGRPSDASEGLSRPQGGLLGGSRTELADVGDGGLVAQAIAPASVDLDIPDFLLRGHPDCVVPT